MKQDNYFIENFLSFGHQQINSIRNSQNRLLDLIFTNDYSNITIDESKPLSCVDNYHPPILSNCEWHYSQVNSKKKIHSLKFEKTDFIGFSNFLANCKILQQLHGLSLSEKVEKLHEILQLAISNFVPLRKSNMST